MLEVLLAKYEETFAFDPSEAYFLNHYTHVVPFTTVGLYLCMVHLLPKLLAKVNPEKYATPLKYVMAAWNLFLSVLSLFMLSGIILPYVVIIRDKGFIEGSICDSADMMFKRSTQLFWVHIFIWSKFMELLDTFFLIVKKPSRPVPFLHWYHHATVLLASWYAEYYHYTVGYVFICINAAIHTIMYFYYFLTEFGYRPNWNKLLTMCQIAQMIFGVIANALWAYVFFARGNCQCKAPVTMMIGVSIMYGTYLILFLQFFFKKYFGDSSPRTTNGAATKGKSD